MRLIDADALLEDVRKHSASYFADDFAKEWVDKQPTVDAVPVVRCEKCTYSKPFNTVVIQCTRGAESRLKTDYCSYGKRKDGDNHEG